MREISHDAHPGASWFHYLHGNVPGHQLDWISRPNPLPRGVLHQHIQHLLGLIQSYDVPDPHDSVLTIGNLSRSDPFYQAGSGGLAIVLHTRIPSCLDHGGRPNPRYVHALLSVGRDLPSEILEEACEELLNRVLGARPAPDRPADRWYERYVAAAEHGEDEVKGVVRPWLEGWDGLPGAVPGAPQYQWVPAEGEEMPRQVCVLGAGPPGDAESLRAMCRIASALYGSTLRWHSVTTAELVHRNDQGLVVQVLAQGSQAVSGARVVELAELEGPVEHWIHRIAPLVRMEVERFAPLSSTWRGSFEGDPEDTAGLELEDDESTDLADPAQFPRSTVGAELLGEPSRARAMPRPISETDDPSHARAMPHPLAASMQSEEPYRDDDGYVPEDEGYENEEEVEEEAPPAQPTSGSFSGPLSIDRRDRSERNPALWLVGIGFVLVLLIGLVFGMIWGRNGVTEGGETPVAPLEPNPPQTPPRNPPRPPVNPPPEIVTNPPENPVTNPSVPVTNPSVPVTNPSVPVTNPVVAENVPAAKAKVSLGAENQALSVELVGPQGRVKLKGSRELKPGTYKVLATFAEGEAAEELLTVELKPDAKVELWCASYRCKANLP